jgi:DNA helicase-2/ATP-dependent DNA helicase PcrA
VALRGRGVPYQLVRGLEFFKRREIRDAVAWLRLLKNPRDDEAFLRVVNVPPRGIGKQSLDRLLAWAGDQRSSLLEAAAVATRIPGISKRSGTALAQFARLHAELAEQAGAPSGSVAMLLDAVLEKTGYRRMLAEEGGDEGGEDRLANVEELVTAARQCDESFQPVVPGDDALGAFLETTALVADTDVWDAEQNRVSLMTLHAAKGLEFPVVYLVAMEDGILPHERSLDQPDQLEEERRLVFVGITRGREEVHASASRMRDYRGTRRISAPSLFLAEMTGAETVVSGAEAPTVGASWARWGTDTDDYSQAAADDDAADIAAASPTRTPTTLRPDGLVLELEESDPEAEAEMRTPRRQKPAAARRHGLDAAIGRASDLANRLGGQPPVKRTYEIGQRVRHAEYGEGSITGISGTGPRAVGTVIFDGPAGTRKFILGHGALE